MITIACPGSKSMTQRALIMAALSEQASQIVGALDCDDSRHLTTVLQSLGCTVHWDGDFVRVRSAPLLANGDPIHVGNAGTAMRFASCLSLVCDGELVLDGEPRMRERPIGPLGDALVQLGVQVRYLGQSGFPPLALSCAQTPAPSVDLDVSQSSQYASGLVLVAPRLPEGLRLGLSETIASRPYLEMTIQMMQRAGATVEWTNDREIVVTHSAYGSPESPPKFTVEADWSTAAFIFAAAEIAGLEIQIPNLAPQGESLQGDAHFVTLASVLKSGTHQVLDLNDTPDLIAPLAALALFRQAPTEFRNAEHVRIKECDRIAVLATGFRRIGATIEEHRDGMTVHPLDREHLASAGAGEPILLESANDHRMAMAFGLVSLRVPTITVTQPECVRKSYPGFWDMLDILRNATAKSGRP